MQTPSPTIYNTQRDCCPGLATTNGFPTLSLICSPPCAVYSCYPRLAAVQLKTGYQLDVTSLGAYLIQLWQWEPEPDGLPTLMAFRPNSLPASHETFGISQEIESTSSSAPKTHLKNPKASNDFTLKQSASRDCAHSTSQYEFDDTTLSHINVPANKADREEYVSHGPDRQVDERLLHWRTSVIPGGYSAWSCMADWSKDRSKSTSLGRSAKDALFLAGCLNPWLLL